MRAKMLKRRAISPLIATIILIAITIAGGLLVYSVFFNTYGVLSAKGQVTVEAIKLVRDSTGSTVFTITLKSTGNNPVTALTVNLAGTEYTVTFPGGTLQPGQRVSCSNIAYGNFRCREQLYRCYKYGIFWRQHVFNRDQRNVLWNRPSSWAFRASTF
jgi:flagellin-like protein